MEISDSQHTTNTSTSLISARALIPGWNTTPFPSLTLTTTGLIALADLRTVAHRTAIRGGSSWIDAIVLAPGLQYQQACDYFDRENPAGLFAIPLAGAGGQVRYEIKNSTMANYLARLSRGELKGPFIVDIGSAEDEWDARKQVLAIFKRGEKTAHDDTKIGLRTLDWLSHFFFLLSPLLTISTVYLMVLFEDIWGLCFIVVLIISRLLNIWAIKNRTEITRVSAVPPTNNAITEYSIDLSSGSTVRLRGLDADLQALTTKTWLRAQSVLDGYLEAVAKMMVYLVAALSGNMTQAGAMTLMGLLLLSAMLLGLSNAHAKGIRVGGRYAMLETDRWGKKRKGDAARHRV